MSIADDIRGAAFSLKPADVEDLLCSVLMTDAELTMKAWPGEQYRTFMLIVAESFDDREARDRLESARSHAAREASRWAAEARGQRSTVLSVLRYFGLPEHDWEALRLIREKLEGLAIGGALASPNDQPNKETR